MAKTKPLVGVPAAGRIENIRSDKYRPISFGSACSMIDADKYCCTSRPDQQAVAIVLLTTHIRLEPGMKGRYPDFWHNRFFNQRRIL